MQRKRAETDKQQCPPPPKIKLFLYFCSYLACERILSSDFVCRRLQGIFPLTRISDQDAFKLYNSVSVPSIIFIDFSDFPWCFMYVNTLEGWSARGSQGFLLKRYLTWNPDNFLDKAFKKHSHRPLFQINFLPCHIGRARVLTLIELSMTPEAQSPPMTLNKTAHTGKKGNLLGRSSSPGREEGYGGFWLCGDKTCLSHPLGSIIFLWTHHTPTSALFSINSLRPEVIS